MGKHALNRGEEREPEQFGEVVREIGRKVRFLRTRRYGGKMTQGDVAARAGLSVSFLSMIERGERSPSLETLARIANALGVPLVELFHFRQETVATDPLLQKLVSFARSRSLGRSELEQLLAVARAMFA